MTREHDDSDASGREAYEQLQSYTLTHGASEFVHQYVVDAWAAQHADGRSKPITPAFALVGLSLRVERGFTGREVQRVHMLLARRKRAWRAFPLPPSRGAVTARQAMATPAGPERDRAIDAWCASVWEAFCDSRRAVADLLSRRAIG